MNFRSIIDDSKSINITSRVTIMTIIIDAPSCGIILMTLEVSFMIVIFFIKQATGTISTTLHFLQKLRMGPIG
jgi:hypothetical protein